MAGTRLDFAKKKGLKHFFSVPKDGHTKPLTLSEGPFPEQKAIRKTLCRAASVEEMLGLPTLHVSPLVRLEAGLAIHCKLGKGQAAALED